MQANTPGVEYVGVFSHLLVSGGHTITLPC